MSSLITATILYLFGSSVIRGFALVLIIGVLVSMFSAITVTRSILRLIVDREWARKAWLYGVSEEEFVARGASPRRPAPRGRSVFDIIGKRRWFFLFSALITIPGLLFILLTPLTGEKEGLQFSIDYTGGTKWEIRFEDANVTPDQVVAGLRRQRPARRRSSSRATSSSRSRPTRSASGRRAARRRRSDRAPSAGRVRRRASASARPSPSPRRRRAPSGSPPRRPRPRRSDLAQRPRRRRARRRPPPAPPPRPARRVGRAPRHRRRPATGNTELPTDGKLGEIVTALEAELGPIAAQGSLTTIGPVVSADLINQALILIIVGSLGILALDHATGSAT